MAQKDNILQELKELQSSLANEVIKNVYQVPAGYFDGLADQVLNRVRAMEAEDAKEELYHLSPLLAGISKKMPYSVPDGFFNDTDENLGGLMINDELSAAKELEQLSPLLSNLKKDMPYTVPQGYFENLSPAIRKETKVISIARQKWFRYAAAAIVTGLVVMTGFLIFHKPNPADPGEKSLAWVKKNLKKVSTDDIDKFVQLADVEAPAVANNDVKESNVIKEMMKDVPVKDIQKFLDETPSDEPADYSDSDLMN